MRRDPLLYGVIGALIGGVIVWFMATSAVNNSNTGMMRMMGMQMQVQEEDKMMEDKDMSMESSMDQMMDSMSGKTGDDFDQAFMSAMIVHHQGAIEMAEEAKVNAKHDEIRKMADDIISAQSSEIEMMKDWQKAWGY